MAEEQSRSQAKTSVHGSKSAAASDLDLRLVFGDRKSRDATSGHQSPGGCAPLQFHPEPSSIRVMAFLFGDWRRTIPEPAGSPPGRKGRPHPRQAIPTESVATPKPRRSLGPRASPGGCSQRAHSVALPYRDWTDSYCRSFPRLRGAPERKESGGLASIGRGESRLGPRDGRGHRDAPSEGLEALEAPLPPWRRRGIRDSHARASPVAARVRGVHAGRPACEAQQGHQEIGILVLQAGPSHFAMPDSPVPDEG